MGKVYEWIIDLIMRDHWDHSKKFTKIVGNSSVFAKIGVSANWYHI